MKCYGVTSYFAFSGDNFQPGLPEKPGKPGHQTFWFHLFETKPGLPAFRVQFLGLNQTHQAFWFQFSWTKPGLPGFSSDKFESR